MRVAANRRSYALSAAAESQRQLCESEDYVARALACARPRSWRNRLIAIEHRVERNRRLDPCQRRTQAVVDSAAECEMAGPIALDVELLRVRKYCGIAVGGSECDRHDDVRKDSVPADFGFAPHPAIQNLNRAFITQRLFDSAFDQRAIFAEAAPQIGLRRKEVQQVADEVGGGLVARDQKQDAEAQQFRFCEPLAVDFRLDQRGYQILGAFGPPFRGDASEICPYLNAVAHPGAGLDSAGVGGKK